MDCSRPGSSILHYPRSLLNFMSTELVILSNHLILCRPLLLCPSIFPSIRVFSESVPHIRWSKYWSFSFHISPPNEYDWAPCRPRDSQESSPTPPFKSINSLVLSLLYGPTLTSTHDYWQTTALTIQTFVSKMMCLLFNMLSRFVIASLPRSKHLLISWPQSPSAVIFERKKKPVTVSIVSPSVCHEVMGLDAMIFVIWMLSFKLAFSLSPFTLFMKFFSFSSWSSLVSLHFLPLEWSNLHNWGWWYFSQQS